MSTLLWALPALLSELGWGFPNGSLSLHNRNNHNYVLTPERTAAGMWLQDCFCSIQDQNEEESPGPQPPDSQGP